MRLDASVASLVAVLQQDSTAAASGALNMSEALRDLPGFVAEHWPLLLYRAAILIGTLLVFWFLARLTRRVVRRVADSENMRGAQLLEDTLVSVSGKVVIGLGVVVGLSLVGVQLGPVLAGLGIAGFVLGFALQDTLANFAAGTMILVYSPFDVGDAVEVAGVTGKVHSMSLVSTTILTFDNQRVIVPNGKIWGDVIRNITAEDIRRVDMVFGISYADAIPEAEDILRRIVDNHELVLDDPEPVIRLSNLGDSSVDFIVRPWSKTEDYWNVKWDITRSVKLAFDEADVTIPFPQRDVHLFNSDESVAGVSVDA